MAIGGYQPKTAMTEWDEFADRVLGKAYADRLRKQQARIYSSMVYGNSAERRLRTMPKAVNILDVERARRFLIAGRGMGKNLLMAQEVQRRADTSLRLKADLSATAPAATAEQSWAGYRLKVRRWTREERAIRRELRWMHGYLGAGATEEMRNDPKVWGAYTQVHDDWSELTKRFYGVKGGTYSNVIIPVREQG